MVRSTFDWSLWIILVFDGLAHPHSWIPYVQIGFNMHLYIAKIKYIQELALMLNNIISLAMLLLRAFCSYKHVRIVIKRQMHGHRKLHCKYMTDSYTHEKSDWLFYKYPYLHTFDQFRKKSRCCLKREVRIFWVWNNYI
jgi:hypothetical protein